MFWHLAISTATMITQLQVPWYKLARCDVLMHKHFGN
jgi:hypothetical protein